MIALLFYALIFYLSLAVIMIGVSLYYWKYGPPAIGDDAFESDMIDEQIKHFKKWSKK